MIYSQTIKRLSDPGKLQYFFELSLSLVSRCGVIYARGPFMWI